MFWNKKKKEKKKMTKKEIKTGKFAWAKKVLNGWLKGG